MATTATQVSPQKLMQLGVAFWGAKAFHSAVELGVFTRLAQKPVDAETLRLALGLHPRSARDFFDALVSLGLLERDGNNLYHNTPEADFFLDQSKPSYIGGFFTMVSARNYRYWANLTEALQTGNQQNESKGDDEPFEKMYSTPEKLRAFLGAMTAISSGVAVQIAEHFPAGAKTFYDIGVAEGGLAVGLAKAHPHLTGGGFDLPAVQPVFEEFVAKHGLQDRLKFKPGNFFTDSLPQADVLTMGHILHDWDLDQKKMLIAKAYAALPTGGHFLVYDTMIDDERRHNTMGLLMSLNMLVETPGGFDYTVGDCKKWLTEGGFTSVEIIPLAGPHSLAVARK